MQSSTHAQCCICRLESSDVQLIGTYVCLLCFGKPEVLQCSLTAEAAHKPERDYEEKTY